jgi:hypothetical protein
LQIELQQTPSTQSSPLLHWSSPVHAPPRGCRGVHVLFAVLQNAFAAQSPSVAHIVAHAPFVHTYGAQTTVCVAHAPLPSHVELCATAPLHVLAPHGVFGFDGPHVPSCVPDSFSEAAHATHVVVLHAVSQQNPSTQLLVTHSRHPAVLQSLAALHAAPCALRGWHLPVASQ